jgi:hypothetical protein
MLEAVAEAAREAAAEATGGKALDLAALAAHYAASNEALVAEARWRGNGIFPMAWLVGRGEALIRRTRNRFSRLDRLFHRRDCALFVVLGQSNAANHGSRCHVSRADVYALDLADLRCVRAADPLPGASGEGGSIWSKLGDLLIARGLCRSAVFLSIAEAGTFVADWAEPGRQGHERLRITLERLRARLRSGFLDFDAVFWQQGEAEANLTDMAADTYRQSFGRLVNALRKGGVYAPIFIARSTLCEGDVHAYRNHAAIRQGQAELPDIARGLLAGPDLDTIGIEARSDGCHFSGEGLDRAAGLWLESLERSRHLLVKLPPR